MKKIVILTALTLFAGWSAFGQWINNNLPEGRIRMGSATLGSKAYFAGGENDAGGVVSAVEIYNVETEDWDSTITLSAARMHIACGSAGSKVFFAGGINMITFEPYDVVDIWDTLTREWEVEHLLFPRFSVGAVSYDNKVLFAGGVNFLGPIYYDLVEIYDLSTGGWTYTSLSLARSAFAFACVNDLALFAGGSSYGAITDVVDIYNFSTGTWSTATLSQARAFLTATTVGSKVFFAGGVNAFNESSDRIDIYDAETDTWSTASLSQARAFWEGSSATVCDERAYFVGGGIFDLSTNMYGDPFNIIDVYDAALDTWTAIYMEDSICAHSVAAVNDHLIIAGGMTHTAIISDVSIFIDPDCTVGYSEVDGRQSAVGSHPNPFIESTVIEYELENEQAVSLLIYNQFGQKVARLADGMKSSGKHQVVWNAECLPAGIYYLRLTTYDPSPPLADQDKFTTTIKLIKTR